MGGLKSIKYAIQNWLHFKCKLLSVHDYVLEKKYTDDVLKLQCKKCRKKFGANLKCITILNEVQKLSIYQHTIKQLRITGRT